MADDALRTLLVSATSHPHQARYPSGYPGLYPEALLEDRGNSPSPVTGIDWNLTEAFGDTTLEDSPIQQAAAYIAQNALDFLNGNLSEDSENELSGYDGDKDDPNESGAIFIFVNLAGFYFYVHTLAIPDGDNSNMDSARPQKRARNHTTDEQTAREWYPWQDRIVSSVILIVASSQPLICRLAPLTF